MISRKQALDLLQSDDLIALAMKADAVRQYLHPERLVTYGRQDVSETVAFCRTESSEQHVSRLERLRQIQESTGAIQAVLPQFDGTAVEYLKLLAVSRIYLDSVPHLQTSWTLGLKICQIALRFGADDIAYTQNTDGRPAEEELRRLIRDAGFIPKQRDALFQAYAVE